MKNTMGQESAMSGLIGFHDLASVGASLDVLVASVKASGVPVIVSMQTKKSGK